MHRKRGILYGNFTIVFLLWGTCLVGTNHALVIVGGSRSLGNNPSHDFALSGAIWAGGLVNLGYKTNLVFSSTQGVSPFPQVKFKESDALVKLATRNNRIQHWDATSSSLKESLRELENRVQPNEKVVITLDAHGGGIDDNKGGYSFGLVKKEGPASGGEGFAINDITNSIEKMRAKDAKVAVVPRQLNLDIF